MILGGVTGGVGMGKTYVGDFFHRLGHRVIDTDTISRQLVVRGATAWKEIIAQFGRDILDDVEEIHRGKLANLVFQDEDARKDLEAILHPKIRQEWMRQVRELRDGGCGVVWVIIPLLFEVESQGLFDFVMCVACSEYLQLDRLAKRGWSLENAQRRIRAQWAIEKKQEMSDFVIRSDVGFQVMDYQLHKFLFRLLA